MKNFLFRKLSYILCLAVVVLVGCSDDENVSQYVYEFPQPQTSTMVIGDGGEISFEAAGMWSILTESSWVKFIDNEEHVSSMSGVEGKHSIKFEVTKDNWSFSDQVAKITLNMDSKNVVVATITRLGNQPVFKITQSNAETGEEAETKNISLEWAENSFMHAARIKFSSNFDWELQDMPTWIASNDIYDYPKKGYAGETSHFFMNADYSNYDLEDMVATVKVVNQHDPSIFTTFTITAEGANNLFLVPATLKYNGILFNADGQIETKNGDLMDSYDFNITTLSGGYSLMAINSMIGSDGTKWYGVDYAGNGVFEFEADWMYPDFINSTPQGTNVSVYSYSIAVKPNTAQERTATVFALPLSVLESINYDAEQMLTPEGRLKPEYEKYLVGEVRQDGKDATSDNILSFVYGSMANDYGATLEKSTNVDLINGYINEYGIDENSVYELTYETPQSGIMAAIKWHGSESFNLEVPQEYQSWLEAEPQEFAFNIRMNPRKPGQTSGTVLIMVNERVKYAIFCTVLDGSEQ